MYRVSETPSTYPINDRPHISGPKDAVPMLTEQVPTSRESFQVLFLDTRHRTITEWPYTVSIGSLNASLVHPREVFRPAIELGAAAIILAHNHPSNDSRPSGDDMALTKRLAEVGVLIGIPVLDHIILTAGSGFLSLREYGWPE